MVTNGVDTAALQKAMTQFNAVKETAQAAENEEEALFETEEAEEAGDKVTLTQATAVQEAEAEHVVGAIQDLTSIGQQLGIQLKGEDLADDLDDITAYTEKLKELLAQVEKIIEEKTAELQKLEAEQEELRLDEAAQKRRLQNLEEELENKQLTMLNVQNQIERINKENKDAQEEYDANYEAAYAAAMAEYNPEVDGDQQAFINEKLKGFNGAESSDTASLESQHDSLSSDCKTLNQSIDIISHQTLPNVQHKLRNIETQIEGVEAELQIANADKASIVAEQKGMGKLAADAIKNSVSPAEWAIIEDNNIDLSARMPDGTPQFLAAKTADGKYHIYQKSTSIDLDKYEVNLRNSKGPLEKATDYYAVNIARIYTPAGWGICPMGSGYIGNYQSTTNDSARKVVNFTISKERDEASWSSERACYCTCSPLAFDLNNNGIETTKSRIMYDIDGDGTLESINNVTEGILAFDKDGDGIIGSNGSELFGNNTDLDGDGKADGFSDGFAALKALSFKENLINGQDDMVLDDKDLKALEEKYGLSMKVGGYDGELKSLADLGITQINLAQTTETTLLDDFDGQFNQLMTQEGATFVQNGETKEYVDVWNAFKKKQ